MLIETINLTKTYQRGKISCNALKGISIAIKQKDFTAIMGPSGSGKSTLINILGCLDTPSSGMYKLNGVNIQSLNDTKLTYLRRKHIGFIFQSFNLISNLTVYQGVELPLIYAGLSFKERKKIVLNYLELIGIKHKANLFPPELSGGEQQRVAIARALVMSPQLLIADEPTGNLDSKTATDIMNLFSLLNKQGMTIIIVTHDQQIAIYAHRIIYLKDGNVDNEN